MVWICAFFGATMQAQERSGLLYTDKDCYVVGETVWVKLCMDDTSSRVAYVEISDERQMQAQVQVTLTDGVGWGCIRLPRTMHSGLYALTAYTRVLLKEQADKLPTKLLAVLNTRQSQEEDKTVINDSTQLPMVEKEHLLSGEGGLRTDQSSYAQRSRVTLTWDAKLAQCRELMLSVVRSDCRTHWDNRPVGTLLARNRVDTTPELEGHIFSARLVGDGVPADMQAVLSCVGGNTHLFGGQQQRDGAYLFYTQDVYDTQDVVLSVMNGGHRASHFLEASSPFAQLLPDTLPALYYWYDEAALTERSIAAQVEELSLLQKEVPQEVSELLYNQLPSKSYNLNEYVRFSTVRETLIEFVLGIYVGKKADATHIFLLDEGQNSYGVRGALVLLDGVPIDNHEHVLEYDARLLSHIHQYRGSYYIAGKLYDGVISLLTHRYNFAGMRTDANARMFAYDFPQRFPQFEAPSYETAEQRASRKPDFRHTLYWQPRVADGATDVSFYTSDMRGTYVATLSGLTPDGKQVVAQCEFVVE